MEDEDGECEKPYHTYNSYLNNESLNKHRLNLKKIIQKQKSHLVDDYREIMDQFQIPQIKEFQQNLKSHDIIIKSQYQQKKNIWNKQCIGQITTSANWKIINVKVLISFFSIDLQICNMSIKKLADDLIDENNFNKMQNKDFKGTFGVVLPWFYQGKYYATKLLQLNSQEKIQLSILNAIFQYAYNKLLSGLKVGPKTSKIRGFDLIIYDDCIQFDMELCSSIGELKRKGEFKKHLDKQKDIYASLKLMHSLNIIHHDIKPENIMFSNQYQKFVLIDFGFTKTVDSVLGQKEITLFVGTFNYASSQMKRTISSSDVSVDLYWNDLYGLKLSLQEIFRFGRETSYLMYNAFCYNQENTMASVEYVYFFLIIDLLRNNGDEGDIQQIVKLIGKQIIQQNYHFFVDFFISITPKKSIGFFCQRYLKQMIANDIQVRQKIDTLYQKGWPRMIFIPETFLIEDYQKRFSFFAKQNQNQGYITGFRNIKLIRKNKTEIQKQLLQYANGFHDVYENHYQFFSLILVYLSREQNHQIKQTFAHKIIQQVFPQEFKQKEDVKIASLCTFTVLKCKKYIEQFMINPKKQSKRKRTLNHSVSEIMQNSRSSSRSKSKSPPLVQTVQNQINYQYNLLSSQKKQKRLEEQSRAKSKIQRKCDNKNQNQKNYLINQIDHNKYKNYLYRVCGYLIKQSQFDEALLIINYLVKQVRSTLNLIKIFEFGVIANQNLNNFDQSAVFLKKWKNIFPFDIQENLHKLNDLQSINHRIVLDDHQKEENLQQVVNYTDINQDMKEKSLHLKYWILRYLKYLAHQQMCQTNSKKAYLYLQYCYKLLTEYQKDAFCKQFYGSLLFLQSKMKFCQNQIQESLRLALQSNEYWSCIKRENQNLAVFISNLYCLMGDQKIARNYLNVVKKNIGEKRFLKDQKVLILSGQISLLQFNSNEAQGCFNKVLVFSLSLQKKLRTLMSFVGQFKGTQSHLFLFKYLKEAEIILQNNKQAFSIDFLIENKLKIIELKFKFYNYLASTTQGPKIIEECTQSLEQCKQYIQKQQKLQAQLKVTQTLSFDKSKQLYLKNISKLHSILGDFQTSLKYIYELKDLLLKNLHRKEAKSKKQYIQCYSSIVQILIILGKDHTDPQMKPYIQYSIQCHMNHDDIIYCFNSNQYTLITLKYLQYNRRYEKFVDVMLQICLFFTKYRNNKRYQAMHRQICGELCIREEANARVIKYFSQVSDQVINQGSQVLLFIYCMYLKQKDLRYRILSNRLIIKHISFLATSTKHIIMGRFFKQIINDLEKSLKLTQNKEKIYLKRHLKCSNMISQNINHLILKKCIKTTKISEKKGQKPQFFQQRLRNKMNKIYLLNNETK